MTRATLTRRLNRIEARLARRRPAPIINLPGLPADLCDRIFHALDVGTFPDGLSNADLKALVAAGERLGADAP